MNLDELVILDDRIRCNDRLRCIELGVGEASLKPSLDAGVGQVHVGCPLQLPEARTG
jgi:hypothetical protein